MLDQYAIVPFVAQAEVSRCEQVFKPGELASGYGKHLLQFLEPLLRELDVTVDKRPLRTLVQTVEAIVAFRDRNHGLLLSQLGDAMDGLGRGGGTKRLSTLIHQQGWKAQQIEEFLLWRADSQLAQGEAKGEEGLLIWDGTVLEKPESLHGEGLCAVRSSKAGRLTRVKKGYYTPPGKPICVPGLHGIGVLLAYARRWHIEMTFRNLKSELAIQSVRVYDWEGRLKLLGTLTLAYALLMDLMGAATRKARDWLMAYACHRTGTHLREVELPFSRLRLALSKLWLAYPCWFVRRGRLAL